MNQGDAVQVVSVSTTSPFSKPDVRPVAGCKVKIVHSKGNSYPATDLWNGKYEAIIPESELLPGATFKVDIQVPGSAHIVSDSDQIQECPEVDSVYYMLKEIPTSNLYYFTKGIQFYLDFDAGNISSRNFRFDLIETWEYTAAFVDKLHYVCWLTMKIRNIFTLSTKNQTGNKYNFYPLHFADNYSSQRLRYGYSLLVNQYSLNETASQYWKKMKINNEEQGGLYESQPNQIQGNMHNLSDPTRQVLGFFGASSKRSKRIFVSNVPDLPNEYIDCRPVTDPNEDHNPECDDCTAKVGGTNVKPVLWPR